MALMDQIRQSKEQSFLGLDVPHLLESWATKTPDKAFMIWNLSRAKLKTGPTPI